MAFQEIALHNWGMNEYQLPSNTHIGAVHLRTTDAPKLAEFYTNALGLTATQKAPDIMALAVQDSKPLVFLHEDKTAVKHNRSAPGLFHMAFLLPSRVDLGLFLLNYVKSGFHLDGASDHIVSEALYLHDTDGNGIEVYRDRPRGDWKFAPNGELRMSSDPLDMESIIQDAESSGQSWNGMPAGSIIGHVHLKVSNVEKSTDFYNNTIGFDITQSSYLGACFLSAGGYHHHLGINNWQSANTEPLPENSVGLIEWELVIPDQESTQKLDRDNIKVSILSS